MRLRAGQAAPLLERRVISESLNPETRGRACGNLRSIDHVVTHGSGAGTRSSAGRAEGRALSSNSTLIGFHPIQHFLNEG